MRAQRPTEILSAIPSKWVDKIVGDDYYDPEGYDQYGYDRNDVDRAGNNEMDYWPDDDPDDEYSSNWKYEDAFSRSSFDGVKPVVKQ